METNQTKTPLACPFCGEQLKETTFESWKYYCPNKTCHMHRRALTKEQWKLFVCLDKNGKKVYAGDEVWYALPSGNRYRGRMRCYVTEFRIPQHGYGLVGDNDFTIEMFYPSDIELIAESEREG